MSDRFAKFIRTAKLTTYAAQGDAASVPPLLSGTKQLEFADGEFLYRDIYTGMQYFVGQEIVYRYAHPIWSMAYHGGLFALKRCSHLRLPPQRPAPMPSRHPAARACLILPGRLYLYLRSPRNYQPFHRP